MNDSPEDLKEKISCWLDELSVDLPLGRFRFCLSGSLVPVEGSAGQFATCFAMKIAWQTGIWGDWPQGKKDACIRFIQSFQRGDGFFYDSWLHVKSRVNIRDLVSALLGRVSWRYLLRKKIDNLRAETRQSASTLLMVGSSPLGALPVEVNSADDIKKYIQALDWTNPWAAGSHFSHLIFFLVVNNYSFGTPKKLDELLAACLAEINSYFDIESGTWFAGNPANDIKVNGAMKILTALQWMEMSYPDLRRLMDFALEQSFVPDACGLLNRLFVVQQAGKGVAPEYKRCERLNLAQRALSELVGFQNEDGAFSFYCNKSQPNYYSAKVSAGQSVSDLHGTVMITWAIAIALEIIADIGHGNGYGWVGQKP